MSVFSKARSSPLVARPGKHPHARTRLYTKRQEVATYFTDFIDLSSLPAGLLPGDSFLLRRKASRFFMSLALSGEKKKKKRKELVKGGDKRKRFMVTQGGEGWEKNEIWAEGEAMK